MTKILFYEGVLNDDTMTTDRDDTVVLEYWTYANEWSNTLNKMRFISVAKAMNWYADNFSDRTLEQGKRWLDNRKSKDYHWSPKEYWRTIVRFQEENKLQLTN